MEGRQPDALEESLRSALYRRVTSTSSSSSVCNEKRPLPAATAAAAARQPPVLLLHPSSLCMLLLLLLLRLLLLLLLSPSAASIFLLSVINTHISCSAVKCDLSFAVIAVVLAPAAPLCAFVCLPTVLARGGRSSRRSMCELTSLAAVAAPFTYGFITSAAGYLSIFSRIATLTSLLRCETLLSPPLSFLISFLSPPCFVPPQNFAAPSSPAPTHTPSAAVPAAPAFPAVAAARASSSACVVARVASSACVPLRDISAAYICSSSSSSRASTGPKQQQWRSVLARMLLLHLALCSSTSSALSPPQAASPSATAAPLRSFLFSFSSSAAASAAVLLRSLCADACTTQQPSRNRCLCASTAATLPPLLPPHIPLHANNAANNGETYCSRNSSSRGSSSRDSSGRDSSSASCSSPSNLQLNSRASRCGEQLICTHHTSSHLYSSNSNRSRSSIERSTTPSARFSRRRSSSYTQRNLTSIRSRADTASLIAASFSYSKLRSLSSSFSRAAAAFLPTPTTAAARHVAAAQSPLNVAFLARSPATASSAAAACTIPARILAAASRRRSFLTITASLPLPHCMTTAVVYPLRLLVRGAADVAACDSLLLLSRLSSSTRLSAPVAASVCLSAVPAATRTRGYRPEAAAARYSVACRKAVPAFTTYSACSYKELLQTVAAATAIARESHSKTKTFAFSSSSLVGWRPLQPSSSLQHCSATTTTTVTTTAAAASSAAGSSAAGSSAATATPRLLRCSSSLIFSSAVIRGATRPSLPSAAVAFAAAADTTLHPPSVSSSAAAAATSLLRGGSFTAAAVRRGRHIASAATAAAAATLAAATAIVTTAGSMMESTKTVSDCAGAPAAAAGASASPPAAAAAGEQKTGGRAGCASAVARDCKLEDACCEVGSATTAAAALEGEGDAAAATASKKAQKKKEKEAAKAAAQAAKRQAQEAEQRAAQAVLQQKVDDPMGEERFGYLPLIWRSAANKGVAARRWTCIGDLQQLLQQQQKREAGSVTDGEQSQHQQTNDASEVVVWVRGRLQESRGKGGLAFLLLREKGATVQCVLDAKRSEISKEMIKWTMSLPLESIVDIEAIVVPAAVTVQAATEQQIELLPRRIYCVSAAAQMLPFQFKDASRSAETTAAAVENASQDIAPRVALDTRLDHRVMDLRTAANQAVFSIVSVAATLFREYLLQQQFVEIHSPKLIAGASEGGASCFTLQYFGRDACLAQSPQLYKQMAICSDFPRVFEIGPVFRAENSNTHRHLCEFTGVDLEMEIKENYDEVLDLLDHLFKYVFAGLQTRCKKEIAAFHAQYPAEPFVWREDTPRLSFTEGVELLRAAGCSDIPDDISHFDLNTEQEKLLGKIIKEKYNTDYYMVLQYPSQVRPFYTMPSPDNPAFSNSYDFFMRTEEIISGAQRVHDAELLTQRCIACGVPPSSIQTYIEAFRLGCPPHGGAGIGLERVVMLFLGAKNIRQVSLFPRDPKRLTP